MTSAIETADLSKAFGSNKALSGLDLRVERGEVFGLIGPNGAGKTTTMRLLLDLIRPSGGSVKVLGLNPHGAGPELRRRVSFLPGELRLTSRVTGRELLEFYARLAGNVPTHRIDELAERLGVTLTARVGTLSKGNKQKLGLIQAFMRGSELLILDEPTSGLDPVMQREFLQLVREAQSTGSTVLLSSHVLSEVQQVAGRAALLRQGRLARLESVAALRAGAPRRLRLNVATGHEASAAEALRALAGVVDVQVEGPSDAAAGTAAAGSEITARYTGQPGPLLDLVKSLRLTDLVIAEPDLEEAVVELYGEANGVSA